MQTETKAGAVDAVKRKRVDGGGDGAPTLELRGVEYARGEEAYVYPTDLALRLGEFSNLLGVTRAGKTTLMRLMAGLETPSGGAIYARGEDVTGRSPRERDIAMVYQQFVNYPTMNVFDNIAVPLRTRGKAPADLKQRVGKVAELLRISELLPRMPSELSGGQQQRTALARALVRHAELVLLDEPLANLDYKLREELREELPRLFAERGSVIVYATTEPDEALLMGGRTAALHEGRIVQFGDSAEVYHNPRSLAAARIFSNPPLNEMAVAWEDGKAVGLLGATQGAEDAVAVPMLDGAKFAAALPERRGWIAFRAHHLKLGTPSALGAASGSSSDAGAFLRLRGEAVLSEIFGSESFVHVRAGACEWVLRTQVGDVPADGERVEMYVAARDLLVFTEAGARTEVH